jgi:hypothetical protein
MGKRTKFVYENFNKIMMDNDNRKIDEIMNIKPMIIQMYKTIYAEDSISKTLFELKAELGNESRLSPLIDKVMKAGQNYQKGEYEIELIKYEKTYQILRTHDQDKNYNTIGMQIICGYIDALWDAIEEDSSNSFNNEKRKEIRNHGLELAVDEPALALRLFRDDIMDTVSNCTCREQMIDEFKDIMVKGYELEKDISRK